MPTNTEHNTTRIPDGTPVEYIWLNEPRTGRVVESVDYHGRVKHTVRDDENGRRYEIWPSMFIQPLRPSFLALASAANASANAYRTAVDDWKPPAFPYVVLKASQELLAAVDALTTAIADAEA